MKRASRDALLALMTITAVSELRGQSTVFGPQSYTVAAAGPQQFSDRFALDPAACNGAAVFVLVVENAGVASASIHLNDVAVAVEKDFAAGNRVIEVPFTGLASNVIRVSLKGGRPGAALAISVRRDLEEQFVSDVTYTASGGRDLFRRNVTAAAPGSGYVLVVRNGDLSGGARVATGTVSIGGRVVVDQQELHSGTAVVRKPITLEPANEIVVDVRGHRGAMLSIGIKRRLDDESACGPRVAFTTPAPGADIVDRTIYATGTVSGPRGIGVTVNGVFADVDWSHGGTDADPFLWYAEVAAASGPVTLRAVARTASGATSEARRDVRLLPDPAAPELVAFPRAGVPPLDVTFHLAPADAADVVRYEVDFNGDGVHEIVAGVLPDVVSFNYASAGRFRVTARCVLRDGTTATAATHVLVQPTAVVDALLRGSWERFTAALSRRDLSKAMVELSPAAREKYGPALRSVASALPDYTASVIGFDSIWIGDRAAHYLLRRNIDGRTVGYHVYFTRTGDGVWRLSQF